jgi:lysophospholipase L1-like esterase
LQAAAEAIQPTPWLSRILLDAYFAQLIVPALLIADVLNCWFREGGHSKVEVGVLVVSIIWMGTCVGAFVLEKNRLRRLRWSANVVILSYGCMMGYATAELIARAVTQDAFPTGSLYPPNSRLSVDTSKFEMPGISGIAHTTINELGLRGPALPPGGRVYRIIAVGGSTTESAELDDGQSWPQLVMDNLNRQQHSMPVWVANAGVSGHTTVHHLEMMRQLPALRQADALVFLIGVNDLLETLQVAGAATQGRLQQGAIRFFHPLPYFRRSRLYSLARSALRTYAQSHYEQTPGKEQRQRAVAPLAAAPPLAIGLAEYRQRTRALARECAMRHQRCIFLTQPSLWRADLPPEAQQRLWFGRVEGRGYLSVGDLAVAMDRYNQALLQVCASDHLECYDLASAVPKDPSVMYDDVHFSAAGAVIVARYAAMQLLDKPPFRSNLLHAASAR